MLFGLSFAKKASEHFKQTQTLWQAKGANRSNQGFSKAPHAMLSGEGGSPTSCNDSSHILKEYREEGDYSKIIKRND